jgi:transcriptional regulator with XRE-family HTH domain
VIGKSIGLIGCRVPPILRLAENLRYLRLRADFTQEQMAEIAGFEFKFYQKLEGGKKPQIKVETVERLAKPFGLEAWQLLAPSTVLKRIKIRFPTPRTQSLRGPRAKWKGQP